jgi:3',5'-cyclic AMP phosphodiesterase CpdA
MEKHATNRPYMIAMGNHEYGDLDIFGRNFKYFFPYNYMESWGHYYSFDYSNAHFVMIDSFQNPAEWIGFILEAQEAWLREDLAANRDKWLFVGMHTPIYSTGDYNMNAKLMTQLAPIFYENQVDVVFSGHDHHYEAFWVNRTESWGGTYYFVTGGGGGGLDNLMTRTDFPQWKSPIHNASVEPYQFDYNTLNNQLYGEITHEFMHFEVNGNNLHIQAIRENGTLIQEFFKTK